MTTPSAGQVAEQLSAYADSLRETGAIRTHPVHAAFATVLRHRFLPHFRHRAEHYTLDTTHEPPDDVFDIVYANNALLTHTGRDGSPTSSSSAPSIMAKMLEALDLHPGLRTVEIGAGTGYNAALIHHITGAPVVTVEAGRPAATCGITGIPPQWLEQLAPVALMISPVAHVGRPGAAVERLHARRRPAAPARTVPPRSRPRRPHRRRHVAHAGPVLDQTRYHDLRCYLGTPDSRITRAYPDTDVFDLGVCALLDPDAGTAWIHTDGTMTTTGNPNSGTQPAYPASATGPWIGAALAVMLTRPAWAAVAHRGQHREPAAAVSLVYQAPRRVCLISANRADDMCRCLGRVAGYPVPLVWS